MLIKKTVFLTLIAALITGAILGGYALWVQSFYFDMAPFLTPIEYASKMPIRNDHRGEGDFGARRNGNRKHEGLDILAPVGTPVRAAKGGIAFAGEYKRGMGKFVKIRHKNDLVTIYGHLSAIHIRPIQRVRQGEVIGEVGRTGNARYNGIQPHLHLEVRKRGIAQDPKSYLYR